MLTENAACYEQLATDETLTWKQIDDWLDSMEMLKASLFEAKNRRDFWHLITEQEEARG